MRLLDKQPDCANQDVHLNCIFARMWHEVGTIVFFVEYAQFTKNGKLIRLWLQMRHNQF
ncbi:Uncharacterized protein PRO82_001447 [Candidatus Protochlamydia amoebophila]|nr:Uncharacterized protein [Candidatus Protochlamydia amoebophila]